MKILLLATAFSGLTQRVQRELLLLGHDLQLHINLREAPLRKQIKSFQPDLIICPFLTQRIPDDIWQNTTCLIVHPGIEGDRGPSSLDWTIVGQEPAWGVTLLQAHKEMDAGDIWGTAEFPLRNASKLSLYKREVSTAAVRLIKQALQDTNNRFFNTRPLQYTDPAVRGVLRPLMRQADRKINWQRDNTATIVNKLNAADTSPGVADKLNGVDIHCYGPVAEPELRGKPGQLLALCEDAVCRATVDGAVWIRQMKCKTLTELPAIKLPARQVVQAILSPKECKALAELSEHKSINDIRVDYCGDAAYVYFNFYNGAFSTRQCRALRQALQQVKRSDAQFIVLMGGEDFWSNGIHLNCIEAATNPAEYSWENIQAIDDVVLEIIDSPQHITIAALRNNSGAGGSIMALACDEVIVREGTVHNPHYRGMGLYGSEYWTYLLPKRVGAKVAKQLTSDCDPLLAAEAMQLGFADISFAEDWDEFHRQLFEHVTRLSQHLNVDAFLDTKQRHRKAEEAKKPLAKYRQEELEQMRRIFFDPDSDYHQLRRNFVYKGKVPADLETEVRFATSR